jgi:hypothetical protein
MENTGLKSSMELVSLRVAKALNFCIITALLLFSQVITSILFFALFANQLRIFIRNERIQRLA